MIRYNSIEWSNPMCSLGLLATLRRGERHENKWVRHSLSFDHYELPRQWSRMIEDYTKRSLTFPNKDKLFAFAGIAQSFGGSTPTDYVVGHWKHDPLSPLGMIWHVKDPWHATQDISRAPSWSWASIDGRIAAGNPWYAGDFLADVLAVNVTLEDAASPFGRLLPGGSIQLSTMLFKCTAIGEKHMVPEGSNVERELYALDVGPYARFRPDNGTSYSGATVFCAPLVESQDQMNYILGIVLEPTHEEGAFHRIGFFEIWLPTLDSDSSDPPAKLAPFAALLNIAELMSEAQAESFYISKEQKGNPLQPLERIRMGVLTHENIDAALAAPVWTYTIKIY